MLADLPGKFSVALSPSRSARIDGDQRRARAAVVDDDGAHVDRVEHAAKARGQLVRGGRLTSMREAPARSLATRLRRGWRRLQERRSAAARTGVLPGSAAGCLRPAEQFEIDGRGHRSLPASVGMDVSRRESARRSALRFCGSRGGIEIDHASNSPAGADPLVDLLAHALTGRTWSRHAFVRASACRRSRAGRGCATAR